MVLCGAQHVQWLLKMLCLLGADEIDTAGIIDEVADAEPQTASEAFDLCAPVNQLLLKMSMF